MQVILEYHLSALQLEDDCALINEMRYGTLKHKSWEREEVEKRGSTKDLRQELAEVTLQPIE